MSKFIRGPKRSALLQFEEHQPISNTTQKTSEKTSDVTKVPSALDLKTDLIRFAFQAPNVGYWVWDKQSGQIQFSDAALQMLQLSKTEFSNDIAEIKKRIHPDDYAGLKKSLDKHLEYNTSFEFIFRVKRPDGSLIWVSIAAQANETDNTVSRRVGGSVVDASAQVQLKQQLHQERQNLRLIFDNVPARIWLKDSHNNILRLNKKAADSMKMSVEDVEGASTYDLFPEEAKHYHEADLAVIKSGEPLEGLVEKYTPVNGPHGWVQTDKLPFTDPEKDEKFVLVISTDITQRIEYETEILDNTARLIQANKDLDHFAYMASHDLKAPLKGMTDLTQWIADDLGDDITPNIQKMLNLLRGRVSRMDALLKDIYAFSRAGKNLPGPEDVDLRAILDDVTAWVSPPPGFKIISDTDLPTLSAPRSAVELICLNLLTNAVKHHDKPEGVITVGHRESETHHLLYVKDDGPGIPEEYQNSVFEIFRKLKPRDDVEGSGMGLAIVKKMTDALGGKIEILSEDGKRGTTFNVSIPKLKP